MTTVPYKYTKKRKTTTTTTESLSWGLTAWILLFHLANFRAIFYTKYSDQT